MIEGDLEDEDEQPDVGLQVLLIGGLVLAVVGAASTILLLL